MGIVLRVAGACFKEKAHIQKGMVAGTDLKIGVPLVAEASGRPFPEPIKYCNEAITKENDMFVLMHIAMPIGKGTKSQCEAMILKLCNDKIKHEQFLILTLAEYEQLNEQ